MNAAAYNLIADKPDSYFSILFEDENLLVIDKLCAFEFHANSQNCGLFHAVKHSLKLNHLYPVQRLDTGTTGVLVFAKNQHIAARLGAQFEQHTIEKYYVAISNHRPKKKQGLIVGDMQKSRRGSYKLLRSKHNPARTQFFSQSFFCEQFSAQNPFLRAFILRAHTGKTHQLRVALKALGAPIIGDERYGSVAAPRLYLHAQQLSFCLQKQNFKFYSLAKTGELFLAPSMQTLLLTNWRHAEQLNW